MKKLLLATSILLLAAACNKPAVQPVQNHPTSQNQQTNETADWKTYTNSQYGFEFKYPSDWKVNNDYLSVGNGKTYLSFAPAGVNRESVFPGGCLNQECTQKALLKDIIFAGKKAIMYECPVSNPCPQNSFYIKSIELKEYPSSWNQRNELGYDIHDASEADYETVEKILSTFKFTN